MNITNNQTVLIIGVIILISTFYVIYQNQMNLKTFRELIFEVKSLNSTTNNHMQNVKDKIMSTSDKLNQQVSSVEKLCLNQSLGSPEDMSNKLKGQYENFRIPTDLINSETIDSKSNIIYSEDLENIADDESDNIEDMNQSINSEIESNNDNFTESNNINTDSNEDEFNVDEEFNNLEINEDINSKYTNDENDSLEPNLPENSLDSNLLEINSLKDNSEDNIEKTLQINTEDNLENLIDKNLLEKMTLKELKTFASSKSIVQKGTKNELLHRVKGELNLN